MFSKMLKNRYIFFIGLIVITRLLYTLIGVSLRETYNDKLNSFPHWNYNSKFEAINTWAIWDSGFYYKIATEGYPSNYGGKKLVLNIPQGGWIRLFAGGIGVGSPENALPVVVDGKNVTNALFVLGSESSETSVELYNIGAGGTYCVFTGPLYYERDVAFWRESLHDQRSCVSRACDRAYATYYSAPENLGLIDKKCG